MSALFKNYKTDKSAEVNGVPVTVGINEDDKSKINFILARAGGNNKAYGAALTTKSEPHAQAIAAGALPEELAEEITKEVFVDSVLKGWENVRDADNKPLEFSKENALKLFDELPDLFEELALKARKISTFKTANLEVVAKN